MMTAVHSDPLQGVLDDVVTPAAADVDRNAAFPRAALDALAAAGYLGLASAADVGGGGGDMRAAADVIERLAARCGSTAMVVLMHYAATAAIEAHGPRVIREEIARGRHLTALAFSEAGSRSHFWAPTSTAVAANGSVRIDARKSWVTSAGHADSYVWSSLPLAAAGQLTLWLMPADADGLAMAGDFDGLGLRGNDSRPISATGVMLPPDAMLGVDGSGLDIALTSVLPWFLVLNAAFCLGLMEAVTAETGAHLGRTRLEHLDQTLAEQPVTRLDFARMRVQTDTVRAFLDDTLAALEQARTDATLRVLEVKAVAGEAAVAVTEQAMKVCGGAAFRRDLGIERRFRDARAARVMAPTSDALLDFVGRAVCGLPLLDEVVNQ